MILRPLKRVCFSGIKSDRRQNSSGRMYLARCAGGEWSDLRDNIGGRSGALG